MDLDFLINSNDLTAGNPNDFYVELPPNLEVSGYTSVEFVSASLKNSLYRFNGGPESFIHCGIRKYSSTAISSSTDYFSAQIPSGTYSPDELSDQLELVIPQALSATHPLYPALTLSVSHNARSQTWSISVTSAWARGSLNLGVYRVFIILDKDGDYDAIALAHHYYNGSLNQALGIYYNPPPPDLGTGFAASQYANMTVWVYYSDMQDSIETAQALILCTDLCGGNIITSNRDYTPGQALAVIPMGTYGQVTYFEPSQPRLIPLTGDRITRVHIWLLNEHLRRAQIGNSSLLILLRFHK